MNLDWNEIFNVMKPLVLFVVGMIVYSVFIFKFYRFLSRRDIFKLNLREKHGGVSKFFGVIWYVIEHLLLFPAFVFVWFAVISVLLMLMAKNQTASSIFLISIALVSAVRATAYYHEDLSRDLAKMLPFALLGIFLIDITYFSLDASLNLVKQIPSLWRTLIYYLVFIILLEFVLRILSFIVPKKEEKVKKK